MPRDLRDCHVERLAALFVSGREGALGLHLAARGEPHPQMWPPSSPLEYLFVVGPELGGPTTDASGRPLRTAGAICHTRACFVMSCVNVLERPSRPLGWQ